MSEIKTFTGIMFDPLIPDPDKINIHDIAHALSMLCRANGHFRTFYSVGMNSINCAKEAAERGHSVRVQLACLLHDGSEAYLADVTRPVKQTLPQYLQIEKPLQDAIWEKWIGILTQEELAQVFAIDDAMLWHEFLVLMDTRLYADVPALQSQPQFAFSGFEGTEQQYIALFEKLMQEKQAL